MVPQNHTEHHSQTLQQQNDVYQSVPSQQTNLVTESSHQAMSMTTDPSQQYHQAPQVPQQMTVPVAPTAPGINFLQESQIDMGSPQMDPAVVVVHHTAPPTQGQSALPLGAQQPTNIATTVQNQVCHECHKNFETYWTLGLLWFTWVYLGLPGARLVCVTTSHGAVVWELSRAEC